ncbi:hypothetical protein [Azohydromonas aeria]|uniref:hypothetical protein n=1 Tax=Azohydromonas aeria TaxID=2590212 RepID=UPI0012F8219D|nr:hypothetical protein [Azohydromonas aeria]
MNALAGCAYTMPRGVLPITGRLRIWVAGRKGNNTQTDAVTFGLRVGTTGTASDPLLGSFGFTLQATSRSWAFMTHWRVETATRIRRVGAIDGVGGETSQIGSSITTASTTDTLPDVSVNTLQWRLHAQMSAGSADWVVVDDFAILVTDPY